MGTALTHAQAGDEDDRQAARKHRAILEAATTVFLENGYLGASMDQVAARAGVSKQTVYKHFEDKEHLFADIVTRTVDEAGEPTFNEVMSLGDSGDLHADLADLAARLLTRVIQPRMLQLRRLVIGEAGRFPELGRVFYERGPGRTLAALTDVFAELDRRGLMDAGDPGIAAEHFNWLIMSAPLNRAMFFSHDDLLPEAELHRVAQSGVEVFMARYGRRRPATKRPGNSPAVR
jgi:AcrR family transcriptional regulator